MAEEDVAEIVCDDPVLALGPVLDGATVLVGGFGEVGAPFELLNALLETDAKDLVLVANNAGTADRGIARLLSEGRIRRMICSYPRSRGSYAFEHRYRDRQVELELVPQGTLSERIRAGGAGLGPFFSPVGADATLAFGKEWRLFEGIRHVLEYPICADLALVHAALGDVAGNLTYRASARNLNVPMATAARRTVAEVERLVEDRFLEPEHVVTPGIFVDALVPLGRADG